MRALKEQVKALVKKIRAFGVARIKDSRLLAHIEEEHRKIQAENDKLMAENQRLIQDSAQIEEERGNIQVKNDKLMAENQSLREKLADLEGVPRKKPTPPSRPPPQFMLRQPQPPQFRQPQPPQFTSAATEHAILSTSKGVQWNRPPASYQKSSSTRPQEHAAGACSSSSSINLTTISAV